MLRRRGSVVALIAIVALTTVIVPARATEGRARGSRGGLVDDAAGPRKPSKASPSLTPTDLPYVPGEVLVKYRAGTPAAERAAIRAGADARLVRRLRVPRLELVRVAPGREGAAIASLERRQDVAYAEPNYMYEASATIPNDPLFTQLWGLHNTGQQVNGASGTPDADIDAPEAWDSTTGSKSVVVAVVDTGVAYDHPDLAANGWANPGESGSGKETNGTDDDGNGFIDDVRGWDFVDNNNDPFDYDIHGTHVAGTIGAKGNNSTGVTGVSWDVSLMALRALGPQGGTNADITEAFTYAGSNGADVVNASLGGSSPSQAMSNSITGASNTLFVVAAGNAGANNDATPTYPCNYTAANLICVAATNSNDSLASFSNYGSTKVHLAAPGTNIRSTVPNRGAAFFERFEDSGWSTRWTTGGTNNTWGRGLDSFGYYLTDSPSGPYANNTNSWARTTAATNLTGKKGCTLGYWLNLDVLQGDALHIEGSTDTTNWTQVAGWHGTTSGWVYMTEDLTTFDGQGQVYIRYRLQTNASGTADGAWIDDVEISCVAPGYSGTEYEYLQGTSMASPHVAGAAALLWATAPSATVSQVRNALLGGVDTKASLSGKVVTGGRLNVKNSLDILTGSPPPDDTTPPETTIVSGPSGSVTSTTAVFEFVSNEANSTFQCSLDGSAFSSCTSPKTFSSLSLGSHTFRVRATDQAGNTDPTPAVRTWTIVENSAPTDVKVGGFSSPFLKATKFGIKMSASDPDGIASYELRYRLAHFSGGFTPLQYQSFPTGELIAEMSTGVTGCFSASATDSTGLKSSYSAQRCTTTPVNNTELAHKGTWSKKRGSGRYLNTFSTAKRRGSSLVLGGVKAKRIALVATKCRGCGTVKVLLGSKLLKKVSLAATGTKTKQIINIAKFGAVKSGTVKIIVTTSGKPVTIEGLGASKV